MTVRASASGEPRREHKNSLDIKRDRTPRYEWQVCSNAQNPHLNDAFQWHDMHDSIHLWDHTQALETEPKHGSPSEVWDCYNNVAQGSNNGEASLEESDSNIMTPEQEFLSYAMKFPPSQFNGIDLLNARDLGRFKDADVKKAFALTFAFGG